MSFGTFIGDIVNNFLADKKITWSEQVWLHPSHVGKVSSATLTPLIIYLYTKLTFCFMFIHLLEQQLEHRGVLMIMWLHPHPKDKVSSATLYNSDCESAFIHSFIQNIRIVCFCVCPPFATLVKEPRNNANGKSTTLCTICGGVVRRRRRPGTSKFRLYTPKHLGKARGVCTEFLGFQNYFSLCRLKFIIRIFTFSLLHFM